MIYPVKLSTDLANEVNKILAAATSSSYYKCIMKHTYHNIEQSTIRANVRLPKPQDVPIRVEYCNKRAQQQTILINFYSTALHEFIVHG